MALKLSQLKEGTDYTSELKNKVSTKPGFSLTDIDRNPLARIGLGIGSSIGQAGFGLGSTALKGASYLAGKAGFEGGKKFLGEAAQKTMETGQEIFKKPFEKELGTISGKAGELIGTGAVFMAPTGAILKSQRILSALSKPITGAVSNVPVLGAISRGLVSLGSKVIPETIISGATEYGRTGGDFESAKTAGLFAGGTIGLLSGLGGIKRATFWPELQGSVTRALGLQGKTTGGRIFGQVENKVAGLGILKKYASETGFKPAEATFEDTLKAWDKTRQKVYEGYNTIAQAAGDKVTINLQDVADSLAQIGNAPRTSAYKNASKAILADMVSNFADVTDDAVKFQDIDPKTIQSYLSDLYNEAAASIAGRSDKAYGEIAAGVTRQIRDLLDNAIESVSGPQYEALRGEYSALKSIEQDLVRRFQQEARQLGGGLTDYANIFSSGDILAGVISANPALVIKGTAQGVLAGVLKQLKKSDRYLRRAFDLIDGKTSSELTQRLFGSPMGRALTPDEAKIVQSAQDYLKNPKIGLGIEDISKKGEGAIPSKLGEKILATGEQKPSIKLKRDVQVTTLTGEKVMIPEDEVLKAYESGGKMLLKDGREYVVSKSQYENIKNNSLKAEAREFAPELKGLEESVLAGIDTKTTRTPYGYQHERTGKPTKFSQYQLPGGENYKEILIKAPETRATDAYAQHVQDMKKKYGANWNDKVTVEERSKGIELFNAKGAKEERTINFKSSHWDEPNVISHLRLNERTYNGKKVTFMEEAQSDWAREGRSKGFAQEITKETAQKQGISVNKAKSSTGGEAYFVDNPTDEYFYRKGYPNTGFDTEAEAWNAVVKRLKETSNAVPSHPLVQGNKWQEPTVKRALQEAVANDSDYFAWITGEQTSARYNLATQVEKVSWGKPTDLLQKSSKVKSVEIKALERARGEDIKLTVKEDGTIVETLRAAPSDWKGKKLDEVLGKGLADSIMAKESGTLSGEGLKFGGEWATNLYDKQIKNIVEDVTGGKVEKLDLGLPIDNKVQEFFSQKTFEKLKPSELKVGLEISSAKHGGTGADNYVITDILGDGKFKAVQKDFYETAIEGMKGETGNALANSKASLAREAETFDISTNTTIQQGIELTPEIKARIRGEAPKLK